MRIAESMALSEKLRILADAAKYDVACTSSGVERKGVKGAVTVLRRMGGVSPFLRF